MTNLRWLKWQITRHYRNQGYQIRLRSIKLGNTAIDGEVLGPDWKMALEIKTPGDDVTRGLGQLVEAISFGYDRAAMVTTLRKAKGIDCTVFRKFGLMLLGVDSEGKITELSS